MSVFDVTKDKVQEIEEIQWCEFEDWNIIKRKGISSEVAFKGIKITQNSYDRSLVTDKEQAENLIKALKKAIELGWLE